MAKNVVELKLYNTMTKQKEIFKPKVEGKVGMYVCGVTVYDLSHIGHARCYIVFDVLYRWCDAAEVNRGLKCHRSYGGSIYLQHLGYEVNYVRNFTDVDDKSLIAEVLGAKYGLVQIIRKANQIGEDPLALSSRYSQEFLDDMVHLQCLLPTHQPRVSDHIEEIKDMITQFLYFGDFHALSNHTGSVQIINNGCAYPVDGDVYFSVDKLPSYGKLSGRKLEDNRAGERVAIDLRKRNPADFALWKVVTLMSFPIIIHIGITRTDLYWLQAAKPDEPCWDSPWGRGRPGWHIECSAMSAKYLSFSFDIHGGGNDLIFPHHENEIAQSCAACSESHVSYWVHNGHVTNNNEKMSKSLDNFFTIRETIQRYHPLALRHFLMSTHYYSPLNYSISQLEDASEEVFYIYQTLQDCKDALIPFQEESLKEASEPAGRKPKTNPAAQGCLDKLRKDFEAYMSDDLHTNDVLTSVLKDALKFINSSSTTIKKQKKPQLPLVHSLIELEKGVREVLNILGLLSELTYSEVLQQFKDKALKRADLQEDDVLKLIEERTMARKNKDFARSDKVREELMAKGIALMDVGQETVWRPCNPHRLEQAAQPRST
ncbi:tRNA synthetases class I, catalytic domain [Dillenia turbinata]|uniref:cysteine--tRNA ligase n=1 Tax=Dillenia turbinata TaxID=194707 RepID=A0AAN8ZQ57_9MAGN